jgi:hypothetical protein
VGEAAWRSDMTDLELLKSTFDKLKIKYRESKTSEETVIQIDSGVGYVFFYADFIFDKDGKFKEHGVWE